MQGLVILCEYRDQEAILDMLEDWKDDGKVVLYGATPKTNDGFIMMQWTQAVPITFQQMQLQKDPGVIDYLVYDIPPVLPKQKQLTE